MTEVGFNEVVRITVELRDGREVTLHVPPQTRQEDCTVHFRVHRDEVPFERWRPEDQIAAAAKGYLTPQFSDTVFTFDAHASLKADLGARVTVSDAQGDTGDDA